MQFFHLVRLREVRKIAAFMFAIAVESCIDPYIPNIRNYKSLLIVEGLITNENISNRVKLSRTNAKDNSDAETVADAYVYIIDGDGIKTEFQNCRNGYYKTDSTLFTGVIGQKYTLHILTNDSKEYMSDECSMLPVEAIDNIYYEKAEEFSGVFDEPITGLRIMSKTADSGDKDQYFRWTFEEVWKTILPGAQRYNYVYVNDSTLSFISLPLVKEVCWKSNLSGDIVTNSTITRNNFINQEILFIDPLKSDRLTREYSILVKQYSISQQEYNFWTNLKKVGQVGGDIFASQPYEVFSNIHGGNEKVLGYFEVSAVSKKRIFISAIELNPLHLPQNKPCELIYKSPDDFIKPKPTWTALYHMYVDNGYIFVRPELTLGAIPEGKVDTSKVIKLVFSTKICSICEYSGFSEKPDFWIDPK